MVTILHVTTHMGGGVGKTLSNIASFANKSGQEYVHTIACLEIPEKTQYIELARENGVPVYIAPTRQELFVLMEQADIVQFEWWHHPLMAQWLCEGVFPPIRVIIWCHVSGVYPPVILPTLLQIPHKFILTTPYSYESISLQNIHRNEFAGKTGVVFGSGGFDQFSEVKRKKHDGFNVGYVGTLDYSKLHPDFAKFCAAAKLPEARFILVGDAPNRHLLENDAHKHNVLEQIVFVGYTRDVSEELASFDVFGYPLNAEHFGASENALLEAMAAGVPPVVLAQAAEKYIVRDMETGLLVNNYEEYGNALRYLYAHPEVRQRLGEAARADVISKYSVEQITKQLNTHYMDVMQQNKKEAISFSTTFGNNPTEWFLSCLGKDKKAFERSMLISGEISIEKVQIERDIANCRRILKSKTKSSVQHFQRYFPDDRWLNYWAEIISGSIDAEREN